MKHIKDDDVFMGVLFVVVLLLGFLAFLCMAAGCHSRTDNGSRMVFIEGYSKGYYNAKLFPDETPETMTQALTEMRDISIDMSECLDAAYNTSIRDIHGISIPRVVHIAFKHRPFAAISGARTKVTECFGMTNVVCNYMLKRGEDGEWLMERWAAETESLYRNEVFGYSNIYNRNIPSPEEYLEAKDCLNSYK